MKLKELRLYGFKSFPHRTVLTLSGGMTALVGPNGCGKSNVLDAIRWVLGEQTLSKLRCVRNEDLIFAGSARLPEQGYADVGLLVENEGDFASLPSEVELRRRYYRTGESGFWINREECRLKEIEAVLRGGAAGGRLYSVFDAGKLAAIVGGDLGNLLESAAGVLGFRERRKEAERKLELVSRDLTRLVDIIAERTRIVRSLARQRRRAVLSKELRSRLVSLEARRIEIRLETISKELGTRELEIAKLGEEERRLLLALEGLRKGIKAQDAELERLLDAEKKRRAVLDEVTRRLSQIVAELSASNTRREALEENLVRIEREQKEARHLVEELEVEAEKTRIAQDDAASRREAAERALAEAREKLRQDEEALASRRAQVRREREEAGSLTSQIVSRIEERTREHSRKENAEALAETERAELKKISERAEAARKELGEVEESLGRANEELARLEQMLKDGEASFALLNQRIGEAEHERQEALERQSMLKGGIASLREKIEEKPKQALRERLGTLFRGWLEEFLSYPEELEAALEAVLYDILGFAAARKLPDALDAPLEGQAGMVLDRALNPSSPGRPDDPRFKLWLADKVKVKSQAPSLLQARLAGWVLVDKGDLVSASEDYPQLSFVTLEGSSVRADGVSLVGRPRGVLADRRTLKKMDKEAQALARHIASLEVAISEARSERQGVEKQLDEAKLAYLEEASSAKSRETEQRVLEENLAELERERQRLRHDLRSREEEAESRGERCSQLEAEIEELEAHRSAREEALSALEKALTDEEEALRGKLAGLNEELLALGREEEAERSIRLRLQQLAEERSRLGPRLDSRQAESMSAGEEIASLEERIRQLREEEKVLEGRRSKEESGIAAKDTSQLMGVKREKEKAADEREAELEAFRAGLLERRTETLLLKREKEELEKTVVRAPSEAQPMSEQEAEAEIAQISRRLGELGPVNEYAAVQYEEEKVELDRLKAQHADITQAAQSLAKIIRDVDEEARSRFETTFRAVREEFRRTFNFFFPGGEADLKFENPEDPFNSPIQITARPEGKQLKRLAQLSDGERTMLGISLLFAFYAVRPAPFLFIDELDAPLDDSNVLRFASHLSRIKEHIQVFVITHNKRTMEKADTIYGVTMEEPGVSKIISVRLKDLRRHHVAVEEA